MYGLSVSASRNLIQTGQYIRKKKLKLFLGWG